MNTTIRLTTDCCTLKSRIIPNVLITLAMTFTLTSHVQAAEFQYSIGQGFEFSTGKYGTNTQTDSIYAPFTVTASPTDRLGLLLEIPFVYQSNGNVVSRIGSGGMQGNSNTTMQSAVGMSGMAGSGTGMNTSGSGMSSTTSANPDQSESGLGDITLKVGYVLLPEKDSLPQIRPTAFVKFPTADKNKSLGTGEFDEGFAVEASKWFGDWNPFAEAGYTVQGKSAQLALRNYLTYNAGLGYQVAENLRPILLIKGTSPPADRTSSLLEVRLKLKYQATNHTGIDCYLSKGITTNSPDYSTGLSIYYDF